MKITQSLTVQVSNTTVIDSYEYDNKHTCTFIENGESLNITFDPSSLYLLSQLVQKLQNIEGKLQKYRHKQIARELKTLSSTTSLMLPIFSSNENHQEIEVDF